MYVWCRLYHLGIVLNVSIGFFSLGLPPESHKYILSRSIVALPTFGGA